MAIDVADELLVPGDIIRMDWEIVTTNPSIESYVVAKIKDAVWSHDLLDYQGSEVETVGDLKLGRDVKLLHVFAKVREKSKATRETIQQAGLSGIVKAVIAVAGLVATAAVFHYATKFLGTVGGGVQETVEAAKKTFDALLPLLVLGGVLWLLFLRK